MGEFVTLTEAARRLGVSEPAMRRRLQRGELQAFSNPRDARSRLIRAEELEAFMVPRPITPAGQGAGGDAMPAA